MKQRLRTGRLWGTAGNWSVLCLLSLLVTGCGEAGPGNGKVTGSVTITVTNGGQPVTGGRVDLMTTRPGEGAGADLDSYGIGKMTEVPVGEYTVTVIPAIAVQVPGQPAPPKPDATVFQEKYRTMKTSPLKITVAKGSNAAKFDLKEGK